MDSTGYSLSDIRAATDGGFGSGNGSFIWIVVLFLFMIGGFGGYGFNRGGYGYGGGCGEPVTEAGLCNAMNFNNLENTVGRLADQNQQQTQVLGNGICSLGYEMQSNISSLGRDVALGQANLQLQASNNAAAISQELSTCCCETQRAIDGVNYNNAMNTAAINANIDAKFAALEKAGLEQRIADQAAKIQSLELAQQMCGVVRYPMSYAYSAGNSPFCGGNYNCGCGCA